MQVYKKVNDDLTQIKGIGPARQLWLAEVFGVRTYADLAGLSADEIEDRLKADDKLYSRSEVELWPQEAERLVLKKKNVAKQNSEQVEPKPGNPSTEQAESENKASPPNPAEKNWQQVACFHITYFERRLKDQIIERATKINYHETDENYEWGGFETERISDWILEHAGDKLRQEILEIPLADLGAGVPGEDAQPAAIVINISGLHLYQPATAKISLTSGKNGRPVSGGIQADQPFTAEAEFEIGEQAAACIWKREIPYHVQFYTQNRFTGDKIHLGDSESSLLIDSKASYSAMLSGITLSPGTYRLRVVVIVDSKNVAPGYLELPMLHVT